MLYNLLAHITILLHFVWILFLIFGFIFALRKSKIALVHVAGLLFSLVLNIFGWYCPLTYLESYLRYLHDTQSTYSGPFILHYMERIIYPDIPALYIRAGEIIFVIFYLVFYTYMAKKHHLLGRLRPR
jgi:hypothetical protein